LGAYVPGQLLPHLKWLIDPYYQHVYYVDGPPQVFDVNIFPDDSTHPHGWGTILVVGMRFGGGPFSIDTDGDATDDMTTRSAIVVFDITDPEQAPTLLAEIVDPSMGFTTSVPQVYKVREKGVGNDWTDPDQNDWFLIFTSGPTELADASSNQTPLFFQYNLSSNSLSSYSINTGGVDGFGGDVRVVDLDRDFIDDVVYAGIVTGTPGAQGGRVVRLFPNAASDPTSTLYNPDLPFVSAPNVAMDSRVNTWVHAGSGRLFTTDDNSTTDQQRFVGAKEPRDSSGVYTDGLIGSYLSNHTTLNVFENGTILPSPFAIGVFSVTTFVGIVEAMITPYTTLNQVEGWFKQFEASGTDPSRRNLSAAVQVSSVLLYTDYIPSGDVCDPEGSSRLNVVDFRTGTAMPHGAIGFNTGIQNNGSALSLSSIELGHGLASSPDIHSGSGNPGGDGSGITVTAYTQKTTGQITRTLITLPPASGGRMSWRELYLD
jgi:type IV pilus assembly protein PilY1